MTSKSIGPVPESMQMLKYGQIQDQDLWWTQPQSTDQRVAITYPTSPSLGGSPQVSSSKRTGAGASLPYKSPTNRVTAFPNYRYTSIFTIGAAALPDERQKRRKLQASPDKQQSAFGKTPGDKTISSLMAACVENQTVSVHQHPRIHMSGNEAKHIAATQSNTEITDILACKSSPGTVLEDHIS
ncbi:hypothetical protein N431DRAFT_475105 [Stipitochalara longipes BDJ]|nr:hypothetical protein N431DRAFT_475105 [Stipitochalara longipes BDJ]